MRLWAKITLSVAGVLLFIVGLAYFFYSTDRSTIPLDKAPEELIVPDYFDKVLFQGQGYPVNIDYIREGYHSYRSVASPEGVGSRDESGTENITIFILPYVENDLPYKNMQETREQVAFVNTNYSPSPPWVYRPERRKGHYKCMSTSSSTILDYFTLLSNKTLTNYTSVFDGKEYRGFNPKALDSWYYRYAKEYPDSYPLTEGSHVDPVSGVPVPYSAGGFAYIIQNESRKRGTFSIADYNLPVNYTYSFDDIGPLNAIELVNGDVYWGVFFNRYPKTSTERIKDALLSHGPLLAGIKIRFSELNGIFNETRLGDLPIKGLSGHAVVIVGFVEKSGRIYFLYRETFGKCNEEQETCGPAYRIFPVYGFNEIYAFERANE